MENKKLPDITLPCPFCGSREVRASVVPHGRSNPVYTGVIICRSCHFEYVLPTGKQNKEKAYKLVVGKWNNRYANAHINPAPKTLP